MHRFILLAVIALLTGLGAVHAQVLPSSEKVGPETTPKTCYINVDTWNNGPTDRTYEAPFYESILRIRVRVNPESCTWRIDATGKPSWIRTDIVEGASAGNGLRRGSGVIDVKLSKNTSYARGGRFRVVSSSFSVPVDIDQWNYIGACPFNPEGTIPGQWKKIAPGFVAITQFMNMPSNNFSARVVDTSTCPLSPRAHMYTFGMTGATIQKATDAARTYQISRPGVSRNDAGEGALFVLNQPGYADFSGVLAQELPLLASLPPELQVTQKLDKTFISFADGGGVVQISGSTNRKGPSSAKPCLFTPNYYKVMAASNSGSWLSVTSESGCKPGAQDHGTLVISALPNNSGARVGAIFAAWGTVIFVVQPGAY